MPLPQQPSAMMNHDFLSSQHSTQQEDSFPSDPRGGEETDGEEEEEVAPIPPPSDNDDDESSSDSDDGFESELLTHAEVIRRIEDLAESLVEALADRRLPELRTWGRRRRRRSNNNDKTKRIVFHNMQQCRTFSNVLMVLSFCHSLLLAQRTTTTREVYYFYVTHFRSQKECDAAIVEAAKLLRVPRSGLGLFASPKGWFCGCIQILRDNGRVVLDGQALSSLQGAPITQEWLKPQRDFTMDCQVAHDPQEDPEENEEESTAMDSRSEEASTRPGRRRRARCILVIEKEGVYNRFSEDRLFDRFPCILVTGKGFPDLATRSFVYTVHKEMNLPVYGLADCNPYGALVLQTYQYGSTRLGMDGGSRYSVPIQWLGLRPSQVEEIHDADTLPPGVFQKLTDLDRKRLEQLLDENHRFHADSNPEEERYEELELMEKNGYKVELESLNWLGMEYMTNWAHDALTRNEERAQEEEENYSELEGGYPGSVDFLDDEATEGMQEADGGRYSSSVQYQDDEAKEGMEERDILWD